MKRQRSSGLLCHRLIHTNSEENMPNTALGLTPKHRLTDDDNTEWMRNAWYLTILDPPDGA